MNDWTAGKLWGNLLVVKGRTSFEKSEVESRFKNHNPILKERKNDKLVELLSKRALGTNPWLKKELGKFAKYFCIVIRKWNLVSFFWNIGTDVPFEGNEQTKKRWRPNKNQQSDRKRPTKNQN